MTKKCIYCKSEIPTENIVDFCKNCGVRVWGEKMFNTIVHNMEEAKQKGDLVHTKSEMIKEEKNQEKNKNYFY